MSDLSSLSPAQRVLLAKALAKAAKKDKPASGLHAVAPFSVAVEGGQLSVGEDEEYTPTTSIPLLPTLVVALHRAGFQRDGIKKIIVEAAATAIAADGKIGDELASSMGFAKEGIKEVQAMIANNTPNKIRKGKTKVVSITLEVEA